MVRITDATGRVAAQQFDLRQLFSDADHPGQGRYRLCLTLSRPNA